MQNKRLILIYITLLILFGIYASCDKDQPTEPTNHSPVINSITSNPSHIMNNQTCTLTVVAVDEDGDELSYSWSTNAGNYPQGNSSSAVVWQAPNSSGNFECMVRVSDGKLVADKEIIVYVLAGPVLKITPDFLDFKNNESSMIFIIKNIGTDTLTWSLNVESDWITTTPMSGTTTTEPDLVTVTVDRTILNTGIYNGDIRIKSNGGNNLVNIVMMVPYVYKQPQEIDDGWQSASLSSVNMNSDFFVSMMNELIRDTDGIHSILIVKDNKLVFEEYFRGWDIYTHWTTFTPYIMHNLASVTKSFTSALFGIAMDYGFIRSVDEKIFSFFPEYEYLNNEVKQTITLHHMLSMTSGFKWNESIPWNDPKNDLIRFNNSTQPFKYLLEKPVENTPGTTFTYNSASTDLIGEVIYRETGDRLEIFSKKYLFNSLGITDFKWAILENGVTAAHGNLQLRPRDMAKLGALFLNKGIWNGERLISREWVEESTKAHILLPWEGWAYGYQWWLRTYKINSDVIQSYHAGGAGGQFIMIFKELNMVVVFTGGNYSTDSDTPVYSRVEKYILPSALMLDINDQP